MGVDRHPDLRQPPNRPFEPGASRGALPGERRLECLVGRVHPEAEHVELAVEQRDVASDRVDLDAGNELEAGGQGVGGCAEFAVRGERVVVGDRQVPDAGRCDVADQDRGLEDAVGAGRVRVEVDDRCATAGDWRGLSAVPGLASRLLH